MQSKRFLSTLWLDWSISRLIKLVLTLNFKEYQQKLNINYLYHRSRQVMVQSVEVHWLKYLVMDLGKNLKTRQMWCRFNCIN